MLRVYTTTDFEGHYSVGVAAIVVAADKGHARRILLKQCIAHHIPQATDCDFKFVELDVSKCGAVVLNDGNY